MSAEGGVGKRTCTETCSASTRLWLRFNGGARQHSRSTAFIDSVPYQSRAERRPDEKKTQAHRLTQRWLREIRRAISSTPGLATLSLCLNVHVLGYRPLAYSSEGPVNPVLSHKYTNVSERLCSMHFSSDHLDSGDDWVAATHEIYIGPAKATHCLPGKQ